VTRSPRSGDQGRRRRAVGDAGLTLIELMVAMALMALIVPLTFPMLTETLRVGGKLSSQSAALDALQIGAASVGRDVRAATCVRLDVPVPPTPGTDTSGSTLVVTIDRDGSTVTVTYDVAGGRLTRSEDAGTPLTVARGLVGSASIFTLHPGARQAVQLDVQASGDVAAPVELHATFTPRAARPSC
jgi:prepilin-type N-terminal cleavage/methylation domain-containing protein